MKKKPDGRSITSAQNGAKGGRPMKYKTVAELQAKIDAYFKTCDCKEEGKFPSIEALALALGIDTSTLRRYKEEDRFCTPIKRAKQKIAAAWEQRLLKPGSGPIFWLKNNAGWKDATETKITESPETITLKMTEP